MEDWNGIARTSGYENEKAMLEALYLTDELPISTIARRLKCGPATIANRLAHHSIPKRPRGGANNNHKLALLLFRMDHRRVFATADSALALLLQCHPSTVYKYKRSVVRPAERN